MKIKYFIFSIIFILSTNLLAQGVKGFVFDENNAPIPGVGVYVKNTGGGAYTDSEGKYYIDLREGEYQLVFSFVGYIIQEHSIIIDKTERSLSVWLKLDENELDEIIIKSKRRDPAYGIMSEASKRRDVYLKQYESSTSEIYIKASETSNSNSNNKKKSKSDEEIVLEAEETKANIDDPFKDSSSNFNTNNLTEVFLTKHFQHPNSHKEIRTGYNQIGSTYGLYYLTTVDDEYNFYNGLLQVGKLTETPIISPLNPTAVLTYKFRLIESYFDEKNRTIYRIEITPRKKGNASVSGIIEIYDETYNIKQLDLSLEKGNLINFDQFNVIQKYEEVDSLWILNYQEFNYETKTKAKEFKGRTVVKYSNFEINPVFGKRFFSNELGITTKEAYERDSSYWDAVRPEPLTKAEQRFVFVRDSIHEAHNRKEYLDSLDKDYNKITFAKVTYFGVGHRNRAKKVQYDFGELVSFYQPVGVGGGRVSPYFTYFKKWKERYVNSYQQISYGLRNNDIKGSIHPAIYYNPFKLGRLALSAGSEYDAINSYDAYINMLRRSNWIHKDFFSISNRIEIVNGLYSYASFSYSNRRPITDLKFSNFFDPIFQNNDPIDFENYQALLSNFYISYIPQQKYMREPNRKVVLGSKWPEFSLIYEKGIHKILGSDINFDYLGGSISQSLKIRTLGTLNYNIKGGRFLNTKDLRYIDYKIFRQSDPWLYSNPLYSFQLLNTSISTTDYFTEAHFVHHFNGALINNFPIIKKTQIKTVVGGGTLWVRDINFIHQELIAGIERNFRIGRQRFRLGAYYVVSESNQSPFDSGFKFSIEFFNSRENKWNF